MTNKDAALNIQSLMLLLSNDAFATPSVILASLQMAYQSLTVDEAKLRENIALAVEEKMWDMHTCLNEQNNILGVITGKCKYAHSLCEECSNMYCFTRLCNMDLIDRQDLINALADTNFWMDPQSWDVMMQMINSIPGLFRANAEKGRSLDTLVRVSSTDTIRREDVVSYLMEKLEDAKISEQYSGICRAIERWVREVPSVRISNSTGQWTEVSSVDSGSKFMCTNCGFTHDHKSHYCENCGAKMIK